MTLTWNGHKLDWVNVVYFATLHVGALLAPWTFSWSALGIFLVLYWLSASVGICLTYHRLLTHRGFRIPKALEYLFTVFGTLASEGGAISWVGMHRMHHTLSDRPGKDLHTPKDGFWWSHLGWIVTKFDFDREEMEARYAPELVADPVHRFLNRMHIFPNIFLGLALFAWGGWPYVVWGVFLRMVVVLHGTWFVNSAAHTFGYRTYDTPEGSTNCWWVGLVAWGEGWHNNHHAFQRSARHGHAWWEVDATWAFIRGLKALGLATDLQLLPKGAERFRLDRKESGGPPAVLELNPAAADPAQRLAGVRLLERRFSARVPVEAAWAHLAKVESWPTWARHIRRVELTPPGPLTPRSEGRIDLTNGVRSTFRMEELHPGASWKWAGPFLWLTVHYDHRFRSLGPRECELTFSLEGEGFGVAVLGRLFAAIYARNLDRAIPRLVAELER